VPSHSESGFTSATYRRSAPYRRAPNDATERRHLSAKQAARKRTSGSTRRWSNSTRFQSSRWASMPVSRLFGDCR